MREEGNGRGRGRKRLGLYASMLVPLAVPAAVRARDDRRSEGEEALGGDGLELEHVYVRSKDGTLIHVTVTGTGDATLFCVHGWTCNESIYRFQQRHFNGRYRVVTMELRGHGLSEIPSSLDYHPDRLAEDLKAVIDHFDPGSFAVAGHSLGGFTSFKFFEHFGSGYRDRLKGMVIIDSSGLDLVEGIVLGRVIRHLNPFPLSLLLGALGRHNTVTDLLRRLLSNSSPAYMVVRWGAFGRKPFGNQVEHVREMVLGTRITSAALAARACLEYHVDYYLPEVDVPVLLLAGDRDKLTNRKVNEETASRLPDARVVLFEGAGHCAQLEQHEAFNAHMEAFLTEVLG